MKAPGPKSFTGLKLFFLLRKKNHLHFFKDFHDAYGDVVRFRFGPLLVHLVVHPDHIKQILVVNRDKYIKGKAYKRLKALLGSGIITSEGEVWKQQRRLAQPFFTPSTIASFDQAMVDVAQETAQKWEQIATENRAISVVDEMISITAKAITRTMFGTDIEEDLNICESFTYALDYVSRKTSSILTTPGAFPTRDNRLFQSHMKKIHAYIDTLVANPRSPLLTTLLEASLSDQEIRDYLVTIFFAGHETTSLLLSWT